MPRTMHARIGKITAALLLLAALAGLSITVAQGQKVPMKFVAVVETEVDPTAKAVSKADVREITKEIRSEAMNNLPRSRFSVMTTESVLSQGAEVLEQCAEENCVIALGRTINADYIVRGTISKLRNNMFSLSVEMYNTDNGILVANTSPVRTAKFEDLFEKSRVACAAMYKTFLEEIGQQVSPAQQTVVQPQPGVQFNPVITYGTLTDPRDGKTYRTVRIGSQTWMAENLNYRAGNSWCYGDNQGNCQKYGRLYDWNTAMSACPAGWRLPSRQDWEDLAKAVGGEHDEIFDVWEYAGKKLKSKSGWKEDNGNGGTDDYGFSALPGGYRIPDGRFSAIGQYGKWWSATDDGNGDVWVWGIFQGGKSIYSANSDASMSPRGKGNSHSVRCVR